MALASNLRSQDGGSKVFMRLAKDFDKVFSSLFYGPKPIFFTRWMGLLP